MNRCLEWLIHWLSRTCIKCLHTVCEKEFRNQTSFNQSISPTAVTAPVVNVAVLIEVVVVP